ncbi:MAG: 30S ribosomal protein S21 [Clostridia bacterium]|nr:30S ribosomal protein S21 [Clostridia bacterium]
MEKDDNSELPKEPKKIDNLEKALRIFKRKSAGIISEVRKREAYDSPSVKRKKKSKEAQRKKRMGYKRGRNYQ